MTRFWLTLDRGVESLARMQGGEIFVPKIPSMRITDLAEAIAPGAQLQVVGIRPGETPEVMSRRTMRATRESPMNHFVILPVLETSVQMQNLAAAGKPCPDGFRYSSDTNDQWLSAEELRALIGLSSTNGRLAYV